MRWVAPTEKDTANEVLEKRLWDAADQFRANSGLKAGQYSTPVLGLIFLRFAEARFAQRRSQLEKTGASARRGTSRIDDPKAYHAEGVLYLTPGARFDYLLRRPEGSNVGRAVNEAMADIEKHNPQLAGVLPRNYQIFNGTLLKELLKKVSVIPVSLDYDAFGRIYEYFLGQFARTEGQKGGEFYTPAPIVRLMVEILEPFHGRILDPACGSGGMFVQSARFVAEHKKNPSSELSIFGVEKTDETGRLCRMNLAVHGLEGDIRHGGEINSYYDDPHKAVDAFDFALANPPFNVNAVDKDRLKDTVGPGRRFPFGLPRTDNANYLWIQLFYSSLNDKGRAAFVMAGGAEGAGGSEQEIRRQLIESRAVDAIVAVGPKMFYTVTVGCVLWFLDRGKKTSMLTNMALNATSKIPTSFVTKRYVLATWASCSKLIRMARKTHSGSLLTRSKRKRVRVGRMTTIGIVLSILTRVPMENLTRCTVLWGNDVHSCPTRTMNSSLSSSPPSRCSPILAGAWCRRWTICSA